MAGPSARRPQRAHQRERVRRPDDAAGESGPRAESSKLRPRVPFRWYARLISRALRHAPGLFFSGSRRRSRLLADPLRRGWRARWRGLHSHPPCSRCASRRDWIHVPSPAVYARSHRESSATVEEDVPRFTSPATAGRTRRAAHRRHPEKSVLRGSGNLRSCGHIRSDHRQPEKTSDSQQAAGRGSGPATIARRLGSVNACCGDTRSAARRTTRKHDDRLLALDCRRIRFTAFCRCRSSRSPDRFG